MRMLYLRLTLVVACFCMVQGAIAEPATSLRVASIQMPVSETSDLNAANIVASLEKAKAAGARVVLFPECALSGFFADAVKNVNWDTLHAAEAKVAAACDSLDVYAILGTMTSSGQERPYNSAVVFTPDGQELTRYHKMAPEGRFEPGDHLALFEIDGIQCTMVICHDERFPELVRIPVLAGAQICFYLGYEVNGLESAVRKQDDYRSQLMARATENNIWVAQSSAIGPMDGPRDGAISLGNSRIYNPGGKIVAEAPGLEEAMLVVDIDPAMAKRGNALESLDLKPLQEFWKKGLASVTPVAAKPAPESATPPRNTVRLGLMKAVPVKWDLDANFKVFLDLAQKASEQKVELFITPECWLDGYAAPDKESTVDRLKGIAQPLQGSPYLEQVSQLAREKAMYICFGFTSMEEGQIYNTSVLYDTRGEISGVYHKTHLQTHDLQFSAGEELPVFQTSWGPLGIMICADRRWPETARTLRLQGARLILNPSYGMHHEKNEMWMRTRSWENQCFIAFTHPETALITNPKGDISGKDESPTPEVLVTEVDLSESKDNNHIQDRRPELYKVMTK